MPHRFRERFELGSHGRLQALGLLLQGARGSFGSCPLLGQRAQGLCSPSIGLRERFQVALQGLQGRLGDHGVDDEVVLREQALQALHLGTKVAEKGLALLVLDSSLLQMLQLFLRVGRVTRVRV